MKAMVLERQGERLKYKTVPRPEPMEKQVLIKIEACGVCRTDLHIIDGELKNPKLPLILGHEIVGRVEELGPGANKFMKGQRVGVPWLGYACGRCKYCKEGLENLCDNALFTGYTLDGGYAQYCCAHEDFILQIPEGYSSEKAAPLLCAGLIGYRSYSKAQEAERIGLYGFGASAHIICQIAAYEGKRVYAFTRDGDREKQEFAKRIGAYWAGGSSTMAPEPLDAAIIFAPVGSLVVRALQSTDKAGKVVCAGIYMSDIPSFPYSLLWEERQIGSVANLTREDGKSFMQVAAKVPIELHTTAFELCKANEAIDAIRGGKIKGAAVLIPEEDEHAA